MNLYVYLEYEKYIDTWVNGGILPLKKVNSYLSNVRTAEKTPDEGVNRKLLGNKTTEELDKSIGYFLNIDEGTPISQVRGNFKAVGNKVIRSGIVVLSPEDGIETNLIDGLVLCFSKSLNRKVAEKFNRSYCVQITDFPKLKKSIDEQLGQVGQCGCCKYTHKGDRNHFLKSKEDSWQNEFRIIWENIEETEVKIPFGIAKKVDLK